MTYEKFTNGAHGSAPIDAEFATAPADAARSDSTPPTAVATRGHDPIDTIYRETDPEYAEAARFLDLTHPGEKEVMFQWFDDVKTRKDKSMAGNQQAPLVDAFYPLKALNDEGRGIYVAPHVFASGKPRRYEHIERAGALSFDDDAGYSAKGEYPLEPSIIVQSSIGADGVPHFQPYWAVRGEPLSLEEYGGLQRRLAADYGGDPAMLIGNCVFRVPGFNHRKYGSEPVRILRCSGKTYTREEILAAWTPMAAPPRSSAPRDDCDIEMDKPDNIELARRYLKDRAPVAVEGSKGDKTAFKVGCVLVRDHALSEECALALLIEDVDGVPDTSWNARCKPAWGLGELQIKVYNAGSYANGPLGTKTRDAMFGEIRLPAAPPAAAPPAVSASTGGAPFELPSSVEEWTALAAEHAAKAVPETQGKLWYYCGAGADGWPTPLPPPWQLLAIEKFPLERYADIKVDLTGQWLIKRLLPSRGLCIVYGPPSCGKSFLVLHAMLHVASGTRYAGHKTYQGRVIYIAAEGQGGFRKRVRAAGEALGLDETTLQFDLITVAPDLGTGEGDALILIEAIQRKARQGDLPVVAIVVDTTSRVLGGADENGEGLATFVKNAGLIEQAFKRLTIGIHHTGWEGTRMRGWSGLHGACDAEWAVSLQEGKRLVQIPKMKDGEQDLEWYFSLRTVTVGLDEDGEAVTTCVVDLQSVPAKAVAAVKQKAASKPLPKGQRDFAASFDEALKVKGHDHRDASGATVRAVYLEDVRRYFAKRWASDEIDERKRQKKVSNAFNRTLGALPSTYHTQADADGSKDRVWKTA